MKKKAEQKPCRKCHGCGLNLGDHCAVFPKPREMWHRHTCRGYKNEEMLAEFEARQERSHPDHSKELRREVAQQRKSEPHWQGLLPYANR